MLMQVGTILNIAVTLLGIGIAWGALQTAVVAIKSSLDQEVKPDLKEIRERFIGVEYKVNAMWEDRVAPAYSPRELNQRGQEILKKSGIKRIIDDRRDLLLARIQALEPQSAYDAERAIEAMMATFPELYPDTVPQLKDGAFRVGADVEGVLFAGSIYLRNSVFPDLNLPDNWKEILTHRVRKT